MTVGDLMGAVSPALFGGQRVVVIHNAQDARKDLAAALLSYAAAPEPDVTLVVTHAGGAKGKALADGLREAGAASDERGQAHQTRERVEFVRDEVRRLGGEVWRRGRRGADRRGRQRPARAGRGLSAAGRRHRRPDRRRHGRPLLPRAGGGQRLHGRRRRDGRRPAGGARGAALGAAGRRGPGADRRRARRRSPYGLAGRLGRPRQRLPGGQHARPAEWKVERAQRQARGWSPESLAKAMRIAADCNAAVKGGVEDRGYALERAVFDLVSVRGSGGA